MDKVVFAETQRFEFWLVIIPVAITGLCIYALSRYKAKQGTPMNSLVLKAVLYLCAAIPVPVMILFLVMSLKTAISDKGVSIKFSPFHSEWQTYSWENIKSCEVKTYDPINEFGGWGLRKGAFNVAGDKGLLLKFTNGKHLLIGTQKPEEMQDVLKKMNKLKQ